MCAANRIEADGSGGASYSVSQSLDVTVDLFTAGYGVRRGCKSCRLFRAAAIKSINQGGAS